MTLPGLLEITPDPEKDAKQKRHDMQDEISGVHQHPVEKKEQHKPHPDDPTMSDEKPSPKL